MRLLNVDTGELVGSTMTTTEGDFSFTGLSPATYMVEVVDADGDVVAVSDRTLQLADGAMTISDAWAPLPDDCTAAFLLTPAGLALLAGIAGGITTGVVVTGNTPDPASPSQ